MFDHTQTQLVHIQCQYAVVYKSKVTKVLLVSHITHHHHHYVKFKIIINNDDEMLVVVQACMIVIKLYTLFV